MKTMNEIYLFPGYRYKQTGVFTYDWFKDGNKLGKKKSKDITHKFNTLLLYAMRSSNG